MNAVRDVERIAVLRANALGDYVFALPALHSLRAAYPGAEIVLLGAPWHRQALAGRPGPVDRVLVVPPGPGIRAAEAGESAGSWAACRAERFDLAVQLHGGGRHSNPLVASLGARVTVGARTADAAALDRTVRYVFGQPEVFRLLDVVALAGAAPVTHHPRFDLGDADRAEAARVAPPGPRPRVVLHPGATDARRRWPVERFAAVGRELAAGGADVVVTGTGSERPLVERLCAAVPAATPLIDALSVGGLGAMLADSALMVANDTGPLHLAAAVGTPSVGIYWTVNLVASAPVDRVRHRPLPSWTVHCPRCGVDCVTPLYDGRDGAPCHHRVSFVTDVTVTEVLREARDLLDTSPAGTPPP